MIEEKHKVAALAIVAAAQKNIDPFVELMSDVKLLQLLHEQGLIEVTDRDLLLAQEDGTFFLRKQGTLVLTEAGQAYVRKILS